MDGLYLFRFPRSEAPMNIYVFTIKINPVYLAMN